MHRLRTVLNYMLHHTFITCLLIIKTELNYSKNAENVWWCLSLLCERTIPTVYMSLTETTTTTIWGFSYEFLFLNLEFRKRKTSNGKTKRFIMWHAFMLAFNRKNVFFLFLSFVIKKEFCFLTADSRYGGVITYYKRARVLTLCAKLNV